MKGALFQVLKETPDQMVLEMNNSILKPIITAVKLGAILFLLPTILYAIIYAVRFGLGQNQISWFILGSGVAGAAIFYLIYRLLLKADSKVVIILDKPTDKLKKIRTQSRGEELEEYRLSDVKQIKMIIHVSQGSRLLMFHAKDYFVMKDQTRIAFWDAADSSNRKDVSEFSEFDLAQQVARFLNVPFIHPEKIPAVTGVGFSPEIE